MRGWRKRAIGALVAWAAGASALPALGEDSPAVERVRSDLESFIEARVDSPDASIEWPPLKAFDYDVSRVPGELRTELSTRSETPFRGRIAIGVALYVGDQLVKRAVVSPYVSIAERVVVANRSLTRGQIVGAADLALVTRDRAASPAGAARSVEALVGMRARRAIPGDQALRATDFEAVPVVERGDRVTLVLQSGPLLIQAMGKAQETGGSGDWIRVVNLDSKRELTGRVAPDGRVHVAF